MSSWRILITDGLHESGMALLQKEAEVVDRTGISLQELLTEIGAYDGVIIHSRTRLEKSAFDKASRLKVVGRTGSGVDNIDLATAAARRVTVVNAPLAISLAVAEHTLTFLFALAKQLAYADAEMKRGQWLKDEMEGIELSGKYLGIIGMGRIGSMVANRAIALDMIVLGYDRLLPKDEIYRRGATPVELDELYSQADFISLHLPLNPETRNLINGQALGQMKRGVRLICTARGGLMDETALLGALESGQVAGVAMDVFAQEPPGMNPLVTHPHVIATPHIAAQTREAQERAAVDIASEVLTVLRGETPRWKVL